MISSADMDLREGDMDLREGDMDRRDGDMDRRDGDMDRRDGDMDRRSRLMLSSLWVIGLLTKQNSVVDLLALQKLSSFSSVNPKTVVSINSMSRVDSFLFREADKALDRLPSDLSIGFSPGRKKLFLILIVNPSHQPGMKKKQKLSRCVISSTLIKRVPT